MCIIQYLCHDLQLTEGLYHTDSLKIEKVGKVLSKNHFQVSSGFMAHLNINLKKFERLNLKEMLWSQAWVMDLGSDN